METTTRKPEHQETIEIIVGTYDEFLLGYKIGSTNDEKKSLKTLIPTFSVRSHTSSIRSLAIRGKYLASGGTDDKIFIYDMKSRREIYLLLHHFNAVNALEFTPDCSHLLSGGSDGRMYVTRVGNWMVGAEWKKAHGGAAVTNIACHSSSKLAMSLGSDLTLRTWNLVTGRCAFVTNLKTKKNFQNMADCLQYSPESKYFTMSGNRIVEIWDIFEAKMIKEITFVSRPTSICWLTEHNLVVGLENGKLALISTNDSDIQYFITKKSRIKSIAYANENLVTASSNGDIIVWSVNLKSKEIKKIASHNIGCRPTCIALLDLDQFDENYQLNKITDLLPDEEITDDQEEPLNKEKLNKIGSVSVEYDNENNIEIDSSSSSSKEDEKHLIKVKNTRTLEIEARTKNSALHKQNKALNSDNNGRNNKKNKQTKKEPKTHMKDDSFNSSEDEPIIKKLRSNYVTPH